MAVRGDCLIAEEKQHRKGKVFCETIKSSWSTEYFFKSRDCSWDSARSAVWLLAAFPWIHATLSPGDRLKDKNQHVTWLLWGMDSKTLGGCSGGFLILNKSICCWKAAEWQYSRRSFLASRFVLQSCAFPSLRDLVRTTSIFPCPVIESILQQNDYSRTKKSLHLR